MIIQASKFVKDIFKKSGVNAPFGLGAKIIIAIICIMILLGLKGMYCKRPPINGRMPDELIK